MNKIKIETTISSRFKASAEEETNIEKKKNIPKIKVIIVNRINASITHQKPARVVCPLKSKYPKKKSLIACLKDTLPFCSILVKIIPPEIRYFIKKDFTILYYEVQYFLKGL